MFVDLAVITAALAKVQLEEVILSEEDLKSKDWKAKSLTGNTPVLETPHGNLIESAAIARYLARVGEGNLNG
jgi:glutathione S-transferase